MSISKIQKGDSVKVISGKYKNTLGIVSSVRKDKKSGVVRVAISSIEKIAKYQKANKQYGVPGSMKQVDRFVDVSNVSLVDEKGKISKVKIENKDGNKFRVYKSTGKKVEKNVIEKSDIASQEKNELKK